MNDVHRDRDRFAGLGIPLNLAEAEASTWRRHVPGAKLPWKELTGLEAEIGRLELKRQANERQRLEVAERLQSAPARDAELLAQWQRDGQPGARPEPSQPKLEEELKRLQEDEQALLMAVDQATNDRARFVERNTSGA